MRGLGVAVSSLLFDLVDLWVGEDGRGAVWTGGIDGIEEVDRDDDDVDITGADATRFRGVAARCNRLAFDRPDIQFLTKEISR